MSPGYQGVTSKTQTSNVSGLKVFLPCSGKYFVLYQGCSCSWVEIWSSGITGILPSNQNAWGGGRRGFYLLRKTSLSQWSSRTFQCPNWRTAGPRSQEWIKHEWKFYSMAALHRARALWAPGSSVQGAQRLRGISKALKSDTWALHVLDTFINGQIRWTIARGWEERIPGGWNWSPCWLWQLFCFYIHCGHLSPIPTSGDANYTSITPTWRCAHMGMIIVNFLTYQQLN